MSSSPLFTSSKLALRAFVLGAITFTGVGCGTQLQKLSGFRSPVGFATLTATPNSVDFGTLAVLATSANRTVVFKNELVGGQGAGTVTCSPPTLSDAVNFHLVSTDCSALNQGDTCSVVVNGTPTVRDETVSYLSLTCTDTRGASQTASSRLRQFGTELILTVTPLVYDFGNVNTGTNSAAQDFTFGNTGNLSALGCSAPTISDTTNFTRTADTCSTNNLSGGGVCTASFRANPTTTGSHTATISRTCTTGGTVSTTTNMITVNGVTTSLAWTPLTHAFGNINVGSQSANQVFTLTNSGGAAATGCAASTISDTTNFTIVTDTCGTGPVAASSSCDVTVRANPTSSGSKVATISRTCTVGGTVTTTASGITTTGMVSSLAWTPLTQAFGNINVGSNSGTQVFTLTNSGGAVASGCSAPTIDDTTNFTITADTCSTGNLAASGGTCTTTVRANPTTIGTKTTTLTRVCTTGGTITTTPNQITVTGVAPNLAWSPLTYDFGSINVGSNSATQAFTLSNSGGAAATGCSAPTISNTTDFTITADTCASANVAAAGSCGITVRANPASTGTKNATISRTCTVGGTVTTTTNQVIVAGTTASLAWTPLTKDFGNVNVGSNSSTQVFTLANSGTSAATGCSAPSITDTTNFTITADTCAVADVAASGSCTVTVRGNPTTAGAKATTLSRTCTFGGTPTTTANQIIVTGVSASLAWTPLTHDFGNVNLGSNSTTQVFTLTNSGTAIATGCSAPSIADTTNFTITADTCSTSNVAASGGTCTVTVRGNPTTVGAKNTTLSRTCTFGGTASTTSNQIVVTGISASLAWTPLTKDFGDVLIGSNSSTQVFTLNNGGGSAATGCSAPSITDTTNFTITADTCATADVAAAGSCTVTVRGNPTTVGSKATTLSRVCTFGGTISTTANQIVVNGTTASLAWSPLTKDFGDVNLGSNSSTQVFTLSNTGGAAATGCSAPSITDTTNFTITADTCGTSNVAATSGSCIVTIRGNPTTAGAKNTTLSRVCTVGGTPATTTNQIIVTGVTASLAWTPLTKDFGNIDVGSNSSTQVFTLNNSGASAATGCLTPTISNTTDFTITADTCATSNVAAAGSCTVTVRGNPASMGSKTATLSRSCTFGGTVTTTANQIVVNGMAVNLAFSPLTYNFGNINVGANSASQVFTLENFGNKTATGCSAPSLSNTTDFSVVSETCGTSNVAASGTCTVTVRANPTTIGSKTATLSRTCTVGGTPQTTTNGLTTNAVLPSLAWSPMTKDFGNVNVGSSSSDQVFTLSNTGGASASGCSAPTIADTTNFTLVSENCGTSDLIALTGSCTATIHANPTSTGAKATTLSRVCTFGGTASTTTNQIVANGIAASLAWTPLTFDFDDVSVGTSSANQTFTLTNSGTATATGCSAPTITDTTNFTIATDNCSTNTLAGSSATCTVLIHSNPTTTGLKTTTLSRTCTFGGTASTTTNQIITAGTAPSLAWSPLTKDFGNVNVGAQSSTQVFTLTNSGGGDASGCSAPSITDTTNFTITADTCGTANLLGGTNATCTVTVRGNPTTTGAKATTLSRTCTYGGIPSTTSNQIVVTGIGASLAWTPLTYDFGNIGVGASSSNQTFTLTNSGAATATGCSAPTITNTTDFTIATDNCATNTLAGSNATCTVLVRANPTTTGSKTATLSRTCTFGGTATTTANQIVVAGTAPVLAWSPLTNAFGNINVGASSSAQTFTLTNSGSATATGCSAPTISNTTDFTLSADTCGTANLAGSSTTCTIAVTANPASTGAKTATLSRTCTFGGTPTTTTNMITVTGISASLAWTPLTKAFGTVNVGASSSAQTFTLTNSGGATATGCSAPTIDNSTDFTLSSDTCGTANLAGASTTCTIAVTANPTTTGAKTATLSRTCTFGGTATTTTNMITVTGAAPSLAWTPLTNDFGNVNVGSNSSNQTFTLTNSGGASATGCSAPTISDTTNFTLSSDTCGTASLAGSNATCTIVVRGNPTTAGAKTATLSRTCTVGGTVTTTANQIVVTGITASLAWTPLTNDFGSINIGSSTSDTTFTLTNSGAATATGCGAPSLSNSTDFTIATNNCGGTTLAGSNTTCTVLVHANPTTAGAKSTTLSRTCTFGGTASTTASQIIVTGLGPSLAWTPLTNAFGNVATNASSSDVTFTLTNSGSGSATGCSAPTITNATQFTIATDNCGTNDLAGSSATCTVLIHANPTTTGAKTTTLSRTCTVGGTVTTTTNMITATGVAPTLAWTPLTKDFGAVAVGANSSNQTFTLKNSGTPTATGCSAPSLTNTTDFTIVTDNCGTNDLAGSNATCTVIIRGNPATSGNKTATLSRTCTYGGTASTTANQIKVAGATATLAWSPLTKNFGNVETYTTSSYQIFTLSNSGGLSTSGCSAPVIGGANADQFTVYIDMCGTSDISAGSSCMVFLQASPTSTGVKTATLSRTCTVGGTPQTTTNGITVTGISTPPSVTTASYSSTAYGTGEVLTINTYWNKDIIVTGSPRIVITIGSTTRYVPFGNGGSGYYWWQYLVDASDLDTDGVAVTTTIDLNGGTIKDAAGNNATLTFTAPSPLATVNYAARVKWTPITATTTYSFSNTLVGSSSSDVVFTLTNSGVLSTTGCAAPTLSSSTDFTLVSNTCGTTNLAQNGTCTVTAHANPAAVGTKTATLTRTCTTGTSSLTLNVNGFTSGGATCTGALVGGYCWFTTTSDTQTCDTFCQTKGGAHDATRFYAGSHGTDANCQAVQTALGNTDSFSSYFTAAGVGCYSGNTDHPARDYTTSTLTSLGTNQGGGSRRVCACGDGSAAAPTPGELATFTSAGAGNSVIVLKATRGTNGGTGIRIAYTTGATAPADCSAAQINETNFTSGYDTSGGISFSIPGLSPSTQYSFRACVVMGSTITAGKTVTDTTSANDPAELARAPVYVTSTQWARTGGPTTSINYSHTVPAGSDRFLLVAISAWNGVPTSATYGGTPLTLLSNNSGVVFYYMINPPVGAAAVDIQFGSSDYAPTSVAASYTGVHQTTPYTSIHATTDSTADVLLMKTGSAQSELVVGMLSLSSMSSTPTIQSEAIIDQTTSYPTASIGSAFWHQPGDAKVHLQWTDDYYIVRVISLKPSAP